VTTRCALLGYPVEHSRSPAMHNAAFAALGMDWSYEAIAVEPDRFEVVVQELSHEGFRGANVTIPHKLRALEVVAASDGSSRCGGSITDTAKAVGAVNTLTFEDGRIAADNTDVQGFLNALSERAPGAPGGMRALVLGAGGAARAVVYALGQAGAAGVSVWNRHPQRAHALVSDLERWGPPVPLMAVDEPDPGEADLIVNATSVGMPTISGVGSGDGLRTFKELPLSADYLHERQVIVDLVYRDGGTPLVRAARARGLCSVDGFDVLVHQGAASFELWTGRPAPLEAMRDGARQRH
jgi:shikimate dehydrogenase